MVSGVEKKLVVLLHVDKWCLRKCGLDLFLEEEGSVYVSYRSWVRGLVVILDSGDRVDYFAAFNTASNVCLAGIG